MGLLNVLSKVMGLSVPFGDPQNAHRVLTFKISNSLQIFESSTPKHPHRGVWSLRMTRDVKKGRTTRVLPFDILK